MVPVVHDGDRKSLWQIAAESRELAEQAVKGDISPDALAGGTFTVSNLGTLGITSFTPIIYTPQVAILGVGSVELKPVRRDGEVQFVEHVGLSLTCDHRVVDGAPGARFLKDVVSAIEGFDLVCALG